MAYIISPQPISLTAVPGQDSTFTVGGSASINNVVYAYQWYLSAGATRTPITGATNTSYTIDPLMGDSGKIFFATVSGTDSATNMLTSGNAFLTVIEDVPPFDVYDLGPETGRQRHLRLRHLGYV
jgi:hypothetical protein